MSSNLSVCHYSTHSCPYLKISGVWSSKILNQKLGYASPYFYILHRPPVDEDLDLAVKVPGDHDLALGLFAPRRFLAAAERLQQEGGYGGEQGAGHHRAVGFDGFVVVVPILPRSDRLNSSQCKLSMSRNWSHLRYMVGAPEEDALVLRPGTDVAAVRTYAGLDLTGQVSVALVFAD